MQPEPEPATLLADLRDHLGYRRIAQGYRTLERARRWIESLEPKPGSGVLVGLVAQWVDAGFDSPAMLSRLLEKERPIGLAPPGLSSSADGRRTSRDGGRRF